MKFKFFIAQMVSFLLGGALFGQTLQGHVLDSDGGPATSAVVYWLGTKSGDVVDKQGNFSLEWVNLADQRLVIRLVGHLADTIVVKENVFLEISLLPSVQDDVEIRDRKEGTFIASEAIKYEVITTKELEKGACCDLAGCFSTQATVRPITTNVVTNSKELRILGVSGVYNQVLVDGFPMLIDGQSYTYGISTIPGALVDKIYVAKGANSVLQGFESISGQINVILKSAKKAPRFFLNLYGNSFLETQYNLHYAHSWDKWRVIVAGHSTQPARTMDRDKDNFLDVAKLRRYSVYNKWEYRDEDSLGLSAKIAGRFVREARVGGQVGFDPDRDLGSLRAYGQTVNFDQSEFTTRLGFRFNDDHNLAFYGAGYFQNQDSWFGVTRYQGQQFNAYANLQYEVRWQDEHLLKTGFSYRHVDREERIVFTDNSVPRSYNGRYLRKESIPGVFAENTFHLLKDKLTLITGMRLDGEDFYNLRFTPRGLVKYDFTEKSSVRFSAGTGWRTANIFTENVNLLASSRDVIFVESLEPERAANLGFNVTHEENWDNVELNLGLDAYHIQFQNQIFPDYDKDPQKVFIGNYSGLSISNGVQAEVKLGLFERAEIKVSYNYLHAYRMVRNKKVVLPFNPLHRAQGAFSYAPLAKTWQVDANLHWYGKQRLANTDSNPAEFQSGTFSNPYTIINLQLTKFWDQFSIYGGCENIFDFRQIRPILSWQDPFGPYFDTSNVWGPTRGREFFVGLRIKLK